MIHNEVIDLLLRRRSVRKYQSRTVDRETIETIVRAGQQAPFASQLYSVVYQTGGAFAFHAPLYLVICLDAHKLELFMSRRGWNIRTNALSLLLLGVQDASYMAENMVIAAESLGLGSCFLGEGSLNARKIRSLKEKLRLPCRVLPIVELVMGYPDDESPVRPRFPLEFTLFEGTYPDLPEPEIRRAMQVMDEGYLRQGYYRNGRIKIPLENGKEETFTFDDYSWTEHISRKWGQWGSSPDDLLDALAECGFPLEKTGRPPA